jgi:hypothetical protein
MTTTTAAELDLIINSAKNRFIISGDGADQVRDLEGIISECWGLMTTAQRELLMYSKLVCELRSPIPTSVPETVSLPHHHHVVTYSSHQPEETMFQSMLVRWYEVADILRQQPAGTVAKYLGGSLFMGSMNGELYLFDSPDLDIGSQDWNMFRPDDFNGIGESDLEDIRDHLVEWLQNQTYDAPVSPEAVAAAINHTYTDPHSQPHWTWDGVVHV